MVFCSIARIWYKPCLNLLSRVRSDAKVSFARVFITSKKKEDIWRVEGTTWKIVRSRGLSVSISAMMSEIYPASIL